MLTQNSIRRLLTGAADALSEDVAPAVDDQFALMQLRAVRELLLNLADRVDWRVDEIRADIQDIEELMTILRAAGSPDADTGGRASPMEERDRLLASASRAIAWLADRSEQANDAARYRQAVEDILQRQAVDQAARLRSTMYKADTESGAGSQS